MTTETVTVCEKPAKKLTDLVTLILYGVGIGMGAVCGLMAMLLVA